MYNETKEVLLKTHTFCNLAGTVFTKSCLFSLSWRTTCLERPQNLVVALYMYIYIVYIYIRNQTKLLRNVYSFQLNDETEWRIYICISNWLVVWSVPSCYLNQCYNIANWTLRNKLQWHFDRNSSIFVQENAFEGIVCEMAAILFRPQCVDNNSQWKPKLLQWHKDNQSRLWPWKQWKAFRCC